MLPVTGGVILPSPGDGGKPTRNDVNVFNTAVTVNRNGNVGINNTNPGSKLVVTKDHGDTWVADFHNISADYQGVRIRQDSTSGSGGPGASGNSALVVDDQRANNMVSPTPTVHIKRSGANVNGLLLSVEPHGNAGLVVDDGGKVGIGITNPIAKLDVNGNITTPTQDLSTTATPTNFGVYTSEIRLIDTPNGGLKECRVITDNYGEWILVGRYAASAMSTIQNTWSSVSGLTTGNAQSETTEFSADFGDSYPTEVRIMGSTDFTKWRDNRTVDFIYGVPEGRQWKYFFSGGATNGMTSVGPNHSGNNKFGWNINGSYDGFGRWVNPIQTSVGMSDSNVTNPSAAYTTATTNAFNWHPASDAKITVSATRTFSGQDSFETAGFGKDDTIQGFFDEYPGETNNMQGGVDFSSAVWVLIKLPNANSGGGSGGDNLWSASGNDIYNTNPGNVAIGTNSPGTVKLLVQNPSASTNPVFQTKVDTVYNMGMTSQWVSQYVSKIQIGRIGTSTSQAEFIYDIAGTEYASIKRNYGASSLKFERGANLDMIIDGTGNVAIGYSTTSSKLSVNGNVTIGTNTVRERLTLSGKIYVEEQGVDWNETTPGLAIGTQHFDPVGNAAAHTGNAITFGASDTSSGETAQAGIYTRSDGTYGTKMYFATTDSYSAGSKTSMMIDYNGAIKFNKYDGANKTGTPTYMLGTDSSGNVVKTASSPGTSTATSLYDLIPNGSFTTTYAFTSTAGVYAEVMESNDVITSTGTYSVQMTVNDYAVGGTQYGEVYSGVMSWHATSTNDNGVGAISEIPLHRAGHAGNSGITYLRTRETPAPDNVLKLEIMCNKTYTSASNVIFKFVKLI